MFLLIKYTKEQNPSNPHPRLFMILPDVPLLLIDLKQSPITDSSVSLSFKLRPHINVWCVNDVRGLTKATTHTHTNLLFIACLELGAN